jgi:proteasome accessory factor C
VAGVDVPRVSADDRLRRLLALVPWVAAHDGPTVQEVCTRFGCTEQELVEDLDLLFLCGLYPYTPDVLIETDIADGRVWIRYAEYFSRPLRLTPDEGLALVAKARTLLAVPGSDRSGPLARGLARLARVVGVDPEEALEIEINPVAPEVIDLMRRAVSEHRQVEMEYYSFGRDSAASRVIDPYSVFAASGQWYVSAFCHTVDDERMFRLDRVRDATALDTTFAAPAVTPDLTVYEPQTGDPRVELDLEPGARWVIEQYPVEAVEERPGGGWRVRLVASERAWLERLLLRLGTDARVVEGPVEAAREAAGRLLSRYR